MKRTNARLAAAAALAAMALLANGCAAAGSGMSGQGAEVWGYVASADDAQLEVAEEQRGTDTIVVDRVLSPGPAWVVVHADDNGMPGERVGLAPIDEGESRDVEVELEGVQTERVIVAIHADRGVSGEFDFDMMDKEASPDRPYFVDRKELAAVVTLKGQP